MKDEIKKAIDRVVRADLEYERALEHVTAWLGYDNTVAKEWFSEAFNERRNAQAELSRLLDEESTDV